MNVPVAMRQIQRQPIGDGTAERAMWCAVVKEQERLAARKPRGGIGTSSLDVRQACAWFGSRDFHAVCALAGLDGDALLARLQREEWWGWWNE